MKQKTRHSLLENMGKYTSDDPDESPIIINNSLDELIEMVDQKLENVPKSENLLKSWKSECNNLISEINYRAGTKLYKAV